ncbi:MAG: peptidoglycan DD-metalloendopeptidase family protein [Saccharospirillum sp.]
MAVPLYQRPPNRRKKTIHWLLVAVGFVILAFVTKLSLGTAEARLVHEIEFQPAELNSPDPETSAAFLPPADVLLTEGANGAQSDPAETEPAELSASGHHEIHYDIREGDSLSAIFDQLGIGQSAMYQIVSADESLLALDILRPGHRLTFRLNPESDALDEMELFIHAGNRVIYRRIAEDAFDYEEILIDGDWEPVLFAGEIHGSFYLSAKSAGLTDAEIATISSTFKEQLNFNRDLRAGDAFQVIRSEQWVDGDPTGQSRIEGFRIQRRHHTHTAFLYEDGRFYNSEGESMERAFRRLPVERQYRISSGFQPRRLHPITGRISPHNGTDFAISTGTPVLSTGDGVVTRVENHPYAGLYVEISHGSQYKTRYLHLSRILVQRGQTVGRGERIALSGNTGRSTGPHLHFELHVNGRPVNAMTADIPLASSVPQENMAEFNTLVSNLVAMMEDEALLQMAANR